MTPVKRQQPQIKVSSGPRERLDLWWPTVLRYGGLALLVWVVAIDQAQNAWIGVIAAGMMGLKDVLNR